MVRSRRSFSPEFREDSVKLVIDSSRPIAQVAGELGIGEATLGNWVAKYRCGHAGEEAPLNVSDRARLREVQRQVREGGMVFDDSDQHRRVHAGLGRADMDAGPGLGRHLMREMGLVPCQPRPFRLSLTSQDADQPTIAGLVDRDFMATASGLKMVGDTTYIPTWQGWGVPGHRHRLLLQEGRRLCDG
jgi:transposase-like protein